MTLTKTKDDSLHKLLLKKIRLEVGQGQAVLQLGEKHEQITDMLIAGNVLKKSKSLSDVEHKKKAFTYVIADMDSPELDDFETFLDEVASMIIRPGLLIIVASNMCTFWDKLDYFMDKLPKHYSRPNRAVASGYLRETLLKKGFFVKNRYWFYERKLLIMADIPNKY